MDKKKIVETLNDVENKSNKDLLDTIKILEEEFTKTKDLIVNLTRHLDTIQDLHTKAYNEINKRIKK